MQIDDRKERTQPAIERPEPAHKTYQLPEGFDLLVACSWMPSPFLEPIQSARIQELLSKPVAWDAFVGLVRRHVVAPLVADRIEKFGGERVPSSVVQSLKRQAFEIWGQSAVLAHELEGLLDRFEHARIDVAPLKGNVLSSHLFGDAAVRHVSDIDLLAPMADLPSAHRLMLSAGYRRTTPSRDLTPKQSSVYLRDGHHFTYRREQPAVSVELHWRLFRWSEEETRLLWGRMRTRGWMGRTVLQPDDALLLLMLCHHGAQHRYSHFKWLADIVTLLASADVDCAELLHLASELDLELPLAQAIQLISRLHSEQQWMPSALITFAQGEPRARRLADEAMRCLLDSDNRLLTPDRRWAGLTNVPYWFQRSTDMAWYWTRLRKRRPLRTRLLPVLISRSDFEAFPLPDRLFWMYYGLRPVFWAIRFIRGN